MSLKEKIVGVIATVITIVIFINIVSCCVSSVNESSNKVNVSSISLSENSLKMSIGEEKNVIATISPSNATNKDITWYSLNSDIAVVNNGTIIAKQPGKTKIEARVDGKDASLDVYVYGKSPIKITNFNYTMDYVCGVQWKINVKNSSSKTINYVTLEWENFNAVGDKVYDDITFKSTYALKLVGPLKPKKSFGNKVNVTKFYNCNYKSSTITSILIEYDDGSSQTIKNADFEYYSGLK